MKYVSVVFPLPFKSEYIYSVPEDISSSLFGKRVICPFGKIKRKGYVIKEYSSKPIINSDVEIKEIESVVDQDEIFNEELLSLALWMEEMYFTPLGVVLDVMLPSGKEGKTHSRVNKESNNNERENLILTKEQEEALERLREKDSGIFYLYGVTGSGKSEVYLERAEDYIKKGKQVLYLVPEIALTEELKEEAVLRFGSKTAILHSSLTPLKRFNEWQRIKKGEALFVLGARSAVFSPFKNLGLIILDEEQDSSYKSGSSPRYNTRQVAQKRADMNRSQFIMGSATPSLEAWNLIITNKITSIVMKERIGEATFPKIRIVNMLGVNRAIGDELEEEIRKTLLEKKGVILFINRRGFFSYVCNSCGRIIECPHCSVPLTYHKKKNRLICHTCGYTSLPFDYCPYCHSKDIIPLSFGTESVEEEVRHLFPDAKVDRLDQDVALSSVSSRKDVLDRFRRGEIDILLGTQMIAKGLNFPRLSLVGIVDIDSLISLPDFRANERAFILLRQVSGRVGRYRPDGKVIIQTREVSSPLMQYLSLNDQEGFYKKELQERYELLFPPFSRFINLTIRGYNNKSAKEEIEKIEKEAFNILNEYKSIEVFHSTPCIVEKKANQWRYHILIKGTNMKELLSFVKRVLSEYKTKNGNYLEVDVDPIDLM